MLENQFFAAIWNDFRCKWRKCSKMGAFLGLWAQNVPKWAPRDKQWAFWVFEVSALILDSSSLELKMLGNQLFAAIWSDLRCKCRKNARKWVPFGALELKMFKNGLHKLKMSFLSLWIVAPNSWKFRSGAENPRKCVFRNYLERFSGLELKILKNAKSTAQRN